jgi:hypothetical protein
MANSLANLSVPANRALYSGVYGFPTDFPADVTTADLAAGGGQFLVLNDLLAFDVRAYDPLAPIVVRNGDTLTLSPGDPGYPARPGDLRDSTQYTWVGQGAFVDLGYMIQRNAPLTDADESDLASFTNMRSGANPNGRISYFSGLPAFRDTGTPPNQFFDPAERFWAPSSGMLTSIAPQPPFVYQTWPASYERDGVSQDAIEEGATPYPDEAVDGLDSDNLNGVDDPGERETSPPYPVALRGIEVRIRMEEFSTRQVRQISVVGDFMP